jgi:hypothetical protein
MLGQKKLLIECFFYFYNSLNRINHKKLEQEKYGR